jgi:WD40 repeat protein
MSFSHSGRYLVSGGIDNGIYFWDLLAKNALRAVSHDHRGWVGSLAWSDDDHVIASASWDNTVGLFRAGDLMPLYCFEHHRDYAAQVAFIPGTSWLVSASYDRTLAVWDWHHAEQVTTFEGHTDWVQSVVWLGEGQLLSASSDRTLRLWSINALRCLRVLGDQRALPLDMGGLNGLSEGSMASMSRKNSSPGNSFPIYRSSGFGDQRVRGQVAGQAAAQPVPQQVRQAVEAAQSGLDQEVSMVVDDAPMLASLMGRGPRRASISPEELAAELSSPRAVSSAREGRPDLEVAPTSRERQDTGSQRWRVWVDEQAAAHPAPPPDGSTTQGPHHGKRAEPAAILTEASALITLSMSGEAAEVPALTGLDALGPAPKRSGDADSSLSGLLLVETALRFQSLEVAPPPSAQAALDDEDSDPRELTAAGHRVHETSVLRDEASLVRPSTGNFQSPPDDDPFLDLQEDDGLLAGAHRLVAPGAPEQGLNASYAPIPQWDEDRSGLLPISEPIQHVEAPAPDAPVSDSAPVELVSDAPAPAPEPAFDPAGPPTGLAATSWSWEEFDPVAAAPVVAPAPVDPAAPPREPTTPRAPTLQLGSVKSRLLGKLRTQEPAPEPSAAPAPMSAPLSFEQELDAPLARPAKPALPPPPAIIKAPEQPPVNPHIEPPVESSIEPPVEPPVESSVEPPVEPDSLDALLDPPAPLADAAPASKTAEFPIITMPTDALPPPPSVDVRATSFGGLWLPWGEEPSEAVRVSNARTTSEEDALEPAPPAEPVEGRISGRTTSEEDAATNEALRSAGLDFASLEEGTSLGPAAMASHPIIDPPAASELSEALPLPRQPRPSDSSISANAFTSSLQPTRQKTSPGGQHKISSHTPMYGSPSFHAMEQDPVEIVDLLAEQTSASHGEFAAGAVSPAPRAETRHVSIDQPRDATPAPPPVASTDVAALWAASSGPQRPAMMIMKRRGAAAGAAAPAAPTPPAPAPQGDWRSWDRLKTSMSSVLALAADDDRKVMITAGRSRDLVAYNAQLERLWDVHTHGSLVNAAILAAAGRVLIAGGDDALVHLWGLSANEREAPTQHAILDGHAGPITRLVLGPTGKVVLSGSDDGTARLWSLEDGRAVATLQHGSALRAMAFGTRGPITADEDPVVRVWDNRGIQLDMLEGFPAPVTALCCHKAALYVGCADGSVALCTPGKREALPIQHRGAVRSIQLLPGGDLLAICGAGGLLQLLAPGESQARQVLDLGEPLEQATLIGQLLVVGTASGALEQLRRR